MDLLFTLFMILLIPVSIIGAMIYVRIKADVDTTKEELDRIKEKAENERKQQEKQKSDTAKKIYTKCVELKITRFDTMEQQDKLRIIASSFGNIDIEEAKKLYFLGEKVVKEERIENARIELEKQRTKEKETYDKQKKEAERQGKSKYTYVAEYHKALDALNNAMYAAKVEGAYNRINTRASNQDWAFLGGIADGLGGRAIGLATASQIQQQNARAEDEARAAREEGWLQLNQAHEDHLNYTASYTLSEEKQEEYVNSRLIDESNQNEKLSLLSINKVSLHITQGKNFILQGTINCEQIFKLLGKPSVLDGSIKINVKNSRNEIVGVGYFAAPGEGTLDLSKVGFYNGLTFQSICWVNNYNLIQKNQPYTYDIQPNHLWLIEL